MQPVYPDPPPCGLLLDLGRAQHPQGVNVVRSPRRREPFPPTELSFCVSARLGPRELPGQTGRELLEIVTGPAGPPDWVVVWSVWGQLLGTVSASDSVVV